MFALTLTVLDFHLVHRCCELFQFLFQVSSRDRLLHLIYKSSLSFLVLVLVGFDFLLQVFNAVGDYLVLLLDLSIFEIHV